MVLPPAVERVLAAAYAEPHRAYHTTAHITELVRWFDIVADAVGWRDPSAVYLAILFHDAVYDPTRADNEARSADLARALVAASPAVVTLIELTARHGSLDAVVDAAADPDAAHFLDSDTAILGAPRAQFDAYDAAIRVEYQHVAPDAYRAGRGAFLARMLARPRLYATDFFHALLEGAARANLARTLARL
ncbi:MAG: hypothetical protein H0X17_03105 [Deltaproteobacteria bacterium]|nr:hypothetical protein [Deltaproteobacteria bacterium]